MLSVDSRHGLGSLLWHWRLEKSVSVHRIVVNWSRRTYQRHGQGCTNSRYPPLHSFTGNGRHASTRPINWRYQYCKEYFTCIWWIKTSVIEITLLRACLPVLNNLSDTEMYSDDLMRFSTYLSGCSLRLLCAALHEGTCGNQSWWWCELFAT